MNILSICSEPSIMEVMRIIVLFINIIKVVVPIILIISLMIKFAGAVTKNDQDLLNKAAKTAIPSAIAAVLIFLVPTFVDIIVRLTFPNSSYSECISGISKETVSAAYNKKMDELISYAKESLTNADYSNAYSYLNNIKDKDEKEKYKAELEELKELIDKKNESNKPNNPSQTSNYEPVLPTSGENVIRSEKTDTLIVNITKGDSYYLTRVWAANPYTQLNKRNAEPYGSKLIKPSDILKTEINEKNMLGKLVVGFNASGFYLKNSDGGGYDTNCVDHNPKVNRTSVGTIVITDGKVIRNEYEKGDLLTWFITGVNPNNQMVVFEDVKKRNTTTDEKKAWSEKVINSGIRNTFTFAAPVIMNGEKTNYNNNNSRMPGTNDSKKGLQMMCQINDNNFVFYTTQSGTRDQAIGIFMNLGCKTAVNLDGGGSVALLYKGRSSSAIETITGNGRHLTEVGYFSEK